MKKIIIAITLFTFFNVQAQPPNLLSGKFSKEDLTEILIPQSDWTPFPKLNDRSGWAKADQEMMEAYVDKAESHMDYDWPYIPATKSLLIDRTGDRDEYQQMSFKKREVLGTMVIAEIYENEGRFIDPIINGVWSICEESFWGVPAHLPKTDEYSGLMDVSEPFVDLFAAETATFLAWVDYYLGAKLDEVSPQIRKRIYYETNNRIFEPLMNKYHGWMGPNDEGRPPNNWNPWICSNWLNTVLLLEKNEDKRVNHVNKILSVLDEFLNPYPQDGGCDEGPGYWGAAAASLFDNLAMLNQATNDAFAYVFEDEKVKNMGRYIYRAQISEDYFLNFADADPQPGMDGTMIYRFGKAIDDAPMMQFGAYYRKSADVNVRFHYFRNFYSLFLQDAFRNTPKDLPLPKDVWLPELQVMIARDQEGTTDGFFVAAKGGHNAESHNHNDIGNYIVYYDGMPLLIDVGRGTYTRRTFSDRRYDIWFNRSEYHNVPTINGHPQPNGMEFKAREVDYKRNNRHATFSLDIAKSYPSEAGVKEWNRTIRLNRNKNVEIEDNFNLAKAESITQHLMTCYPSSVEEPGRLVIHYKPQDGTARDFVIQYDPDQMQAYVEKKALTSHEDEGIKRKWGNNIYRINFKVKSPELKDKIDFTVTPI